jgi:hypothetical protein
MQYTTQPAARAEFITGLRDLADYLATHPGVPVPQVGARILLHASPAEEGGRAQVDHIARQLNVTATDETSPGGHYTATRRFGPVLYEAVSIPTLAMARHDARHSYDDCITVELS